jgi:hypothetical protein
MKMANFESGVKTYITGYAMVEVNFPVDWKDNPNISCNQCKFFSRNNGVCQLTKEISEYPLRYVGSNCPLILKENKENDNV